MKYLMLALLMAFSGSAGLAAPAFDRVDSDLAELSRSTQLLVTEFERAKPDPESETWTKMKIKHMFDVDQLLRSNFDLPHRRKYSKAETADFNKRLNDWMVKVDTQDTEDLKALLKIHGWFTISKFGKETDESAWLLVQHADRDVEFQKEILELLDKLYQRHETKGANYAYLYDRVATNEKRPQRFGTQGRCVGPQKWEPNTLEDPGHIDELRKSVVLTTLEEYKKRFIDICH